MVSKRGLKSVLGSSGSEINETDTEFYFRRIRTRCVKPLVKREEFWADFERKAEFEFVTCSGTLRGAWRAGVVWPSIL
ncbi:hypothetical protein EVAR_13491_1 [Eumeta japonica]|uniref:Uncharacterized protein n=1 Tax=Eumeta variegata TaxID=151549 RepID=A0A4C1UY05_EUMVA|nr:hypothetical protein EVAR_13491_1 [Eumeta japonica]